jgi:thiol-disulfide isomerase/thioredoxin
MALMTRRLALAAGGTLAAAFAARKPHAEEPAALASALRKVDPPEALPDVPFLSADGAEHHLAAYHGQGVVVNLWATWCAPCVAEMPFLAALAAAVAPDRIAVLPLSSDRGGATTVSAWFKAHGVTGLPVLLDPKSAVVSAWKARGIPTSFVINRQGLCCGRLEGAANWSAPDAIALVRKLVGA